MNADKTQCVIGVHLRLIIVFRPEALETLPTNLPAAVSIPTG
jgi:hypothetical protein